MRTAQIHRQTQETDIELSLTLEGRGEHHIETPVPFLNHMLTHVAVHGHFNLTVTAKGDVEVDDHHSVEDIGIVFGQALHRALGDRAGIVRYASQAVPMDEALVLAAVDISGRGLLVYDVDFPQARIGRFETELVEEFLRALAHNAALTLHVQLLHGKNAHHIAEAIFKALGRTLGQAVALDPRWAGEVPSTKGILA
jgi:imidazoleglycerol-phosphate dehydratase